MTQTDRILPRYILSRVRVSVRPRIFYTPKNPEPIVNTESPACCIFRMQMSIHYWTKISQRVPNSTAITMYIFLRIYILPVRNIWTACFLRLFFVFYDIKSKIISNRHSCDVYFRSKCGSCPADVATAA